MIRMHEKCNLQPGGRKRVKSAGLCTDTLCDMEEMLCIYDVGRI
jgi:hypothetical protein